ncbi:endonuclease/exonuclease/phosphatase family protein [Proteiniphilum sp. X52]|uniref:endonuclease/exonuclease/phosphatase family protein n=1 Tax=Proteiniphilum sp. X52 TaxID=2382159 RepID=UPI000F0A7A46|nr:endonuclease/exonuclease/phosphatase family protein [Proteiniphilum sp. X52]RNC65747.1 endonuclease/exonuclease/phosphatase family protein [Proteiniphilum sp. X52]
MKKTVFILGLSLMTIIAAARTNSGIGKECDLRVASFNLRMDTPHDGENAWANRKGMVRSLIAFHDLDIVGTQEGFKHQLDDILELEGYAYVGAGRDDGKDAGEHSAIIYRKERLELIDNGDFWFSETPEVPGKGWDATCCNRICSWAKFKDQVSGKTFFVFNSHYDHQGKTARRNSSLLLLKKIEEIAGKYPVFATGDFNATPDDEPIQTIYNAGKLNDSYLVTEEPPYGTEGTFNAFRPDAPSNSRIDYIWVSPGITVKKYGVLNDRPYGRFPSDHFPVVIQAKM